MLRHVTARIFRVALRRELSKASYQIITDIDEKIKSRSIDALPKIDDWGPIGKVKQIFIFQKISVGRKFRE